MSVEYYKMLIQEIKDGIAKKKADKKRTIDSLNQYIKVCQGPGSKQNAKYEKEVKSKRYDAEIESMKKRLEKAKEDLQREKEKARKR